MPPWNDQSQNIASGLSEEQTIKNYKMPLWIDSNPPINSTRSISKQTYKMHCQGKMWVLNDWALQISPESKQQNTMAGKKINRVSTFLSVFPKEPQTSAIVVQTISKAINCQGVNHKVSSARYLQTPTHANMHTTLRMHSRTHI